MLGQVIERFDSDFYKVWSRYAERILNQVEAGLAKMTFEGEKPPEIEQLEILLKLSKVEKDRSGYIKHVTKIQELLESLAAKDFNNVPANNFFFQARRSMNWLCRSLINDWIKYGEAVINPAAKPEMKSELGFAQKFLLKQSVKKVNRKMLSSLNDNAIKLITTEVQNMPEIKLESMASLPPDVPQLSFLAQRLTPDQYSKLNSQINVVSMEDAAKYWSEQLYGAAFECYYSQIVHLTDILIKAEKMASDSSQDQKESKNACKKLLSDAGFADLSTAEGQNFLNAIAKELGFKNARELHQNYLNLDKPYEFEKLRKTKHAFMEFANKEKIYRENDPLEKSKRIFQAEYARALKSNKKNSKANLAYATTVCYCGIDYVANLESLQKQKNLAQLIGANVIDPRQQQTDVGFWEKYLVQAMLFAARNLNLQDRVDAFLLRSLQKEAALYERKINNASEGINKVWREYTRKEDEKKQKRRNKIIADIENLPEEEKTAEFIKRIQEYKQLWKERVKAVGNEDNRTKFNKVFEEKNGDFILYRNTLDLLEDKNLISLTPSQLNALIQQRQEKIADLKKKMHQMENTMAQYYQQEAKFSTPQKSTFLKKISAQTPWAKSKKKRKQKGRAKLQASAEAFEQLGLELEIENERLQKAINQNSLFEKYNTLDIIDLRGALPNLIEMWHAQNQLLLSQNLLLSKEKNLKYVYQRQKDYYTIDNQLQIVLKCLNTKLASPAEQTKLIQQGSLAISSFINELKKQQNILVDNEDLNQIISTLTDLESQSVKLKQSELIALALKKSEDFFQQEYNISEGNDPFFLFLNSEKEHFALLSPHNQEKLLQDLKEKFIGLLKQKSEIIDRKTLETILFNMHYGVLNAEKRQNGAPENKALATLYQECATKAQNLLQAKYDQIKALDPDDQRAFLAQLDADLIHFCQLLIKGKQEKESIKQSYESILNPFELIVSAEFVENAENRFIAQQKSVAYFMMQFSNILSIYAKEASRYYPTLPLDILNNHILILKDQINKIQSFNMGFLEAEELEYFNKIITLHQQILDIALNQEKNHPDHTINSINTLISNLQQSNLHLGILQESMLQKLNHSYQFDKNNFEIFSSLLSKAEKDFANIQKELSKLEEKEVAKNPHWQVQKMALKTKLSLLQEALSQKNLLQKDIFVLYDDIQKGKPILQETIEPSHLGKAFVLAITHDNKAAFEAILAIANKISMQDLAMALQKAASKGNMSLVNEILKSRTDLTFTHADLLLALKAAVENKHFSIAGKILLEKAFEFDNDLPSLLATALPQKTAISPISRNWGQLLIDNDGAILTQIRDGYRFLELLATTPSETEDAFSSSDLEKIKKQILDPLKARYFENKQRKNSQLEKWDNELATLNTISPIEEIEKPAQDEKMEPYLISTSKPSQISESKQSLPSSSRIQFNQALKYEEQADKLMQTLKEKSWDKNAIKEELIELQHLAGDAYQDKFSQTLSEAVNYCAHHGKLEALQTLLNFLEDSSLKHELAFNALRQAMDAEYEPIVAWLLEKNAHVGKVDEVQAHLKLKNQMHKLELSPIAFQILMYVPIPESASLINMVTKIANQDKPEQIPPVRKGNFQRFFIDTDGPHLEELRTAYLFCEAAFKKQQMALYLKFRNPLDNLLIDKTPEEFTPQEIDEFNKQLQELKRTAQLHKTRILEIKQQYVNWVQSHYEFQNKERMTSSLAEWENAVANMVKKYDKTLQEDIAHGEKILKQCQSSTKQTPFSHEKRRTQRTAHRSQRTVSQRPPRAT